MENIEVLEKWQKMSEMVKVRGYENYYLQNNDGIDLQVYLGEEEPEKRQKGFITLYGNGGTLNNIREEDLEKCWIRIAPHQKQEKSKKVVFFGG